jgi:hypothetical protein
MFNNLEFSPLSVVVFHFVLRINSDWVPEVKEVFSWRTDFYIIFRRNNASYKIMLQE